MRHGPAYRVRFRRRREHKTDYRARHKLLSSSLPRAIVRRSLKHITVQICEYDSRGDKIIISATSKELGKHGWDRSKSNTAAAYLTGYLVGKRALDKGIGKAVLDIGLNNPSRGARVFAALKGMVDAGLMIPHKEKILPSEERMKGAHLGDDAPAKFDSVKSRLDAKWKAK
jgi:large subunit ribosomal protein L18